MKHIYYLFTSLLLLTVAFTSCNKNNNDEPIPEVNYTVTFDADGGTPVPPTQTVKEGGKASAPVTNPSKTGYTFLFWHLSGATTAYDFATPLTSNISLKAQWETVLEYWNITWELNDGLWPSEGNNHVDKVEKGTALAEPAAPSKLGSTFDGWYKDAAFTNKLTFPVAVTSDLKLYAKWKTEDPANRGEGLYIGNSMSPVNLSLVTKGDDIIRKTLSYIYDQPTPNDYTLILENDIQMTQYNGTDSWFSLEKEGAVLTIKGKGKNITITGPDNSCVMGVGEGTLILEKDITLKGKCTGIHAWGAKGTAIMREGSSIQVCGFKSAVDVGYSGNFIMEGGTITGNVSPEMKGGGVSVANNSLFTMKGGSISSNYAGSGGGVHVSNSNFTMEGGWIGNNQALMQGDLALGFGIISGTGQGGGVSVDGGKLIMKGGTIYGSNDANSPNMAKKSGSSYFFIKGTLVLYTVDGQVSISLSNEGDNKTL